MARKAAKIKATKIEVCVKITYGEDATVQYNESSTADNDEDISEYLGSQLGAALIACSQLEFPNVDTTFKALIKHVVYGAGDSLGFYTQLSALVAADQKERM